MYRIFGNSLYMCHKHTTQFTVWINTKQKKYFSKKVWKFNYTLNYQVSQERDTLSLTFFLWILKNGYSESQIMVLRLEQLLEYRWCLVHAKNRLFSTVSKAHVSNGYFWGFMLDLANFCSIFTQAKTQMIHFNFFGSIFFDWVLFSLQQ